jgi:transposase
VIHQRCHHKIEGLQKGQPCLECGRGKLYKYGSATILRISGQTPLTVTQHILERLRCNTCGAYFTAEVSDEVAQDGGIDQKYGYSARAIIGIHKHFAGLPFYRQQTLQQMLGLPVGASTAFDQCEQLANDLQPVFRALVQRSANATHYHLDDTPNRILNQSTILKPQRKTGKLTERKGIYTSGVIATLSEGYQAALFQTNIGYAGEWLDEILATRHADAPIPTLMCDALPSNAPTVLPSEHYQMTLCNSHARRHFVDVLHQFPDKAPWVLEQYALIWVHDKHCQKEKFSLQARLEYHRQHSLPVMEAIQRWGTEQLQSEAVEENSTLGKAIGYFLRHHAGLCRFCYYPGAQLDNNLMERMLKLVIRGRKNALFFNTLAAAAMADVIGSIIATCHHHQVNPFNYLVQLQRQASAVKANPEQWLPWNYTQNHEPLEKAA